MTSKPFLLAANWKMHKGPAACEEFFAALTQLSVNLDQKKLLVFPPAMTLLSVKAQSAKTPMGWGPQNIFAQDEGAFTGENSPQVAAEIGATHVLVGHSERRTLFGESDALLNLKMQAAIAQGLIPIFCIGETLEQRKSQQTKAVLQEQLETGLATLPLGTAFHVAYEPVWAIGTGEVATPQQVREAHEFVRKILDEKFGAENSIAILYGGSVKPGNAQELSHVPEVGGFLIGSASLSPQSFGDIIEVSRS